MGKVNCYKLHVHSETLWKGKYGIVFTALWNEQHVAVKRIGLENVSSSESDAMRFLSDDVSRHQNIVRLFHVASSDVYRY